ncbi:Hemoglobin subunit beta, partial [Bos mutus]
IVYLTLEKKATVIDLWSKMRVAEVGPDTVGRQVFKLLVVYPSTQRFFDYFGDCPLLIYGQCFTFFVSRHRFLLFILVFLCFKEDKMMYCFLKQFKKIKKMIAKRNISKYKLRLIWVASHQYFGKEFTPEFQAACQKVVAGVVNALTYKYH